MTYLIVLTLRRVGLRCLRRVTVGGALLAFAAVLFALDHSFGDRTWGALALATGALLTSGKRLRRHDDESIHFESMRLARACRNTALACLRNNEWPLCEQELYKLIRESLERSPCDSPKP